MYYENGDWARVHISITKTEEKKNKFLLTFSSGEYGTELGRWEQRSEGTIKITIEKCKCLRCEASYDPVHEFNRESIKSPFPLVEIWKVKEQIIKQQKLTTLESPIEKYRLLKRDELFVQEDLESVITARNVVWKNYNNLGEPCSKFQEYKNRFNTEDK